MLDGVPFVVTDALDTLGYPTTAGTSFVRASVAWLMRCWPDQTALDGCMTVCSWLNRDLRRRTHPAWAALRQAGAILVGKANLHEVHQAAPAPS